MRVLIVEDEDEWADAIQNELQTIFGAETDFERARSLEEVQRLCKGRGGGFDLATVDVSLGNSSGHGLEVLRILHEQAVTYGVIVASGIPAGQELRCLVPVDEQTLLKFRGRLPECVAQYFPHCASAVCTKPSGVAPAVAVRAWGWTREGLFRLCAFQGPYDLRVRFIPGTGIPQQVWVAETQGSSRSCEITDVKVRSVLIALWEAQSRAVSEAPRPGAHEPKGIAPGVASPDSMAGWLKNEDIARYMQHKTHGAAIGQIKRVLEPCGVVWDTLCVQQRGFGWRLRGTASIAAPDFSSESPSDRPAAASTGPSTGEVFKDIAPLFECRSGEDILSALEDAGDYFVLEISSADALPLQVYFTQWSSDYLKGATRETLKTRLDQVMAEWRNEPLDALKVRVARVQGLVLKWWENNSAEVFKQSQEPPHRRTSRHR